MEVRQRSALRDPFPKAAPSHDFPLAESLPIGSNMCIADLRSAGCLPELNHQRHQEQQKLVPCWMGGHGTLPYEQ